MNISRPALFASAFSPHVGGVEELTRQLALEQQHRGMSPVVVTMHWPKDLPASEDIDGIPVLRRVFRVPEPSPRFLGGWLIHGSRTKRDIATELRDREVDLIHVQCVSNNARYAHSAAAALRVPLVVSMQGELTMDATGLYQRSAQQRRAWRRLLDAADVVTGCSQSVLDDAQAAYDGAWVSRAQVVPNGVRVADFGTATLADRSEPYVLGVGRMVRQKGFDLLIRAFAETPQLSDVNLVLAGGGPELASLRALAADLDVRDRVRFLGPVDREGAASLFEGATSFVLPSRMEPQGIVVLEAMAAGAPVIATRVGGVPETVADGVNGLLVEPEDASALGAGIVSLLSDPGLRARLIESGRATAAERDWAHITTRYADLYRLACSR